MASLIQAAIALFLGLILSFFGVLQSVTKYPGAATFAQLVTAFGGGLSRPAYRGPGMSTAGSTVRRRSEQSGTLMHASLPTFMDAIWVF